MIPVSLVNLPMAVFAPATSAIPVNKPKEQVLPRRAVKPVGETRDQNLTGITKRRPRGPIEEIHRKFGQTRRQRRTAISKRQPRGTLEELRQRKRRRYRYLSSEAVLTLMQAHEEEGSEAEGNNDEVVVLRYRSTGMLKGQMPAPSRAAQESKNTVRFSI